MIRRLHYSIQEETKNALRINFDISQFSVQFSILNYFYQINLSKYQRYQLRNIAKLSHKMLCEKRKKLSHNVLKLLIY